MVNLLIKASEAIGIKILTNQQVISIEKKADNFLVSTEFKSKAKSETQSFQADMVVHGAGRVPDIEDLCLEKAEVKIEEGAIIVDKHMRTSNNCIYAGGDCASGGIQLTPVAKLQGEIAAARISHHGSVAAVDYTGIPSAVHTIPVMASVGIGETKDINDYKVIFRDRNNWETNKNARN